MKCPFTVVAQPGGDIWKKPPSTDVFTAPSKPHSKAPLNNFISATLTFTAPYTHQYDQAGLLLTLTKPSAPRKWIKTGVEFFNNRPRFSTVCCDSYADWSIAAVPQEEEGAVKSGDKTVTVRVEKESTSGGVCLWVYRVHEDGEKTPLREICWVYDDGGDGWELEVGAAAARPDKDLTESLEARFDKFEVEWEMPSA
ncbi:hypothetical protein NM208_g13684 [Fusarium decemcellulare]|uniref:Uncharacterized protein n=1 Tax=Fusarium decemcellulare TaxID=57161 RepID=A0ACC1RKQ1_9HYPO|nr:hypothetical protein NM208_g13684 [Fusarium decemcellulare]